MLYIESMQNTETTQEATFIKGDKVRYTSPAIKTDGTHYQYETTITAKRTMKATGKVYYSVAVPVSRVTADMLEKIFPSKSVFDYCNNETCGNEIDTPNKMGYCNSCLAEIQS